MPKLDKRLTDGLARTLRGPETEGEIKSSFVIHWCKYTPGFGRQGRWRYQRRHCMQAAANSV